MNRLTEETICNHALALFYSGHKELAYEFIKSIAKCNPTNANFLLWMAFTTPKLEEARLAIQKAGQLDPSNPTLPAARQWIEAELRKPKAQQLTMPAPVYEAPSATPAQINQSALPLQPYVFNPILTNPAGVKASHVIPVAPGEEPVVGFTPGYVPPAMPEFPEQTAMPMNLVRQEVADLLKKATDKLPPFESAEPSQAKTLPQLDATTARLIEQETAKPSLSTDELIAAHNPVVESESIETPGPGAATSAPIAPARKEAAKPLGEELELTSASDTTGPAVPLVPQSAKELWRSAETAVLQMPRDLRIENTEVLQPVSFAANTREANTAFHQGQLVAANRPERVGVAAPAGVATQVAPAPAPTASKTALQERAAPAAAPLVTAGSGGGPDYLPINDPDLAYNQYEPGALVKFIYKWNGETPIIEKAGGKTLIKAVPGAKSFAWLKDGGVGNHAVLIRFMPGMPMRESNLKQGNNLILGKVADKGGGLLVVEVEKVKQL